MIKKIAWETFKKTGDINAFIELKQIENIEKGIDEYPASSSLEGIENSPAIRDNVENNENTQPKL